MGASPLGLPDHVGNATPATVSSTVRPVRHRYPALSLEVSEHNDTGCSIANSLAPRVAGADGLEVTVLGVGKRVGITSLSTPLARTYTVARDQARRYWMELLPALDGRVAELSGVRAPFHQPLTSAYAITHVARVLSKAVLNSPSAYEWIDPAVVRRERVVAAV